jgi:bifunctional DNase/RNase
VDARPSDAIALALRMDAPIFVAEDVISKAKSLDMTKEAGDSDRLRQWLGKLDPEELGKYEM